MERLASLALRQLGHRNAGPFRNNSCNLFIGDALMHQAHILALDARLLLFQLLLKLRQFSVLKFRRPVQVVGLLGCLDLAVNMLNLLAQL